MRSNTIETIRSFNRYYTAVIGILDKNYLESKFSLTEVRILFELNADPAGITAKDLIVILKVDKGYLSRLINLLIRSGLINKQQSVTDKRAFRLTLTNKGSAVFKTLDAKSEEQVKRMLSKLNQEETCELANHMVAIEKLLKNKFPNND